MNDPVIQTAAAMIAGGIIGFLIGMYRSHKDAKDALRHRRHATRTYSQAVELWRVNEQLAVATRKWVVEERKKLEADK